MIVDDWSRWWWLTMTDDWRLTDHERKWFLLMKMKIIDDWLRNPMMIKISVKCSKVHAQSDFYLYLNEFVLWKISKTNKLDLLNLVKGYLTNEVYVRSTHRQPFCNTLTYAWTLDLPVNWSSSRYLKYG